MENYNAERVKHFACLLGKHSVLLNFSVAELKECFTEYLVIVTEHIEKGISEKSVQIRFNEDELTITCTFNDWGKCDCVCLLPDKRETAAEFWNYLKWIYGYDEKEERVETEFCLVHFREVETNGLELVISE